MIRVACLLMSFFLSLGHAQPVPVACIEDTQCSVGYFCEAPSHTCRACLRCQDYKREAAGEMKPCTTSVQNCGPCFEGLVNIYGLKLKGICVPAESLQHLYFYGYLIVAIISLLIVVLFVRVLNHTVVFKISYCDSTAAPSDLHNKSSVVLCLPAAE